MAHADHHDDALGGFCCQGCKDDAEAGRPSSCDGGSCAKPTGDMELWTLTGFRGPEDVATATGANAARWSRLTPAQRLGAVGRVLGIKLGNSWFAVDAGHRAALIQFVTAQIDRLYGTETAPEFGGATPPSAVKSAVPFVAGKSTGCVACGAADLGGGRGTGCACSARRRSAPLELVASNPAPHSTGAMGLRTLGAAAAFVPIKGAEMEPGFGVRATGMLYVNGYSATNPPSAAWIAQQPGETAEERDARYMAFLRTAITPGETQASWALRVAMYYASAPALQRTWIDAMRGFGRLPAAPAAHAATPAAGGELTAAEVAALTELVARPAGQSDADFAQRIQVFFENGASPAQRAWITASRAAGRIPAAPTNDSGANAAAIVTALGPIFTAAGSTVIGLVREANQHDADVRRQEAEAATARIAAATSRDALLVAAVTEAEGAAFDAQTAGRQLRQGDRATATVTLSGAQGKLAAAIGAATAFGTNTTLAASIERGRTAVAATATAIDASAPMGTSMYGLDITNPGITGIAAPTPWYMQPLVVLGAAAVAVAAFLGIKR